VVNSYVLSSPAAGLSFILGMKIPFVRYAVNQWKREHPGQAIPDGHHLHPGRTRPGRLQWLTQQHARKWQAP